MSIHDTFNFLSMALMLTGVVIIIGIIVYGAFWIHWALGLFVVGVLLFVLGVILAAFVSDPMLNDWML